MSCTNIKFKILQVINIHAFCNKFSDSRDHFYVTTVGLHEGIQMQTVMLSSLEAFFEHFRSICRGYKPLQYMQYKMQTYEHTHAISYSNIIGN